ncbi:MAG TPA: DUF2934 domain-containing protein, partial [Streptosporangiaceae bacterium]
AAIKSSGSSPEMFRETSLEMYHKWVSDAAYYRWLNRGRPMGDALDDWVAAEAEYARRTAGEHDMFTPGQVRHKAVEVVAFHSWLDRGRPHGDADADWRAAEALVGEV